MTCNNGLTFLADIYTDRVLMGVARRVRIDVAHAQENSGPGSVAMSRKGSDSTWSALACWTVASRMETLVQSQGDDNEQRPPTAIAA